MPSQEFEFSGTWKTRYVPALDLGLNSSVRVDALDESEVADLENLRISRQVLSVDTGYESFLTAIEGTPRISYQFYKTDGSSELILLTNTRLYKRTSDAWHYVNAGVTTSTTSGTAAGGTTLAVSDITGFTNGSPLGVILDNGVEHQTTVNGTPVSGSIVMTDAVPAGRSVGTSATVVQGAVLTGTDAQQPDMKTVAAKNWVVITNYNDNVKRYNGTNLQDVPNLPSSGSCKAKSLAVHRNALFLVNTIEGGTRYPQRVRWSDFGDVEEWTTGNANYEDLLDREDEVLRAAELGPYLIVYREGSIVRLVYVGEESLVFDVEPTIPGEGVISQDCVFTFKDRHIVVGATNFYEYRGGFDTKMIGDKVADDLFGSFGELKPAGWGICQLAYVKELEELWFLYPSEGADYQNLVRRLLLREDVWTKRRLTDQSLGYGFYQKDSSKSWQEMPGDWDEQQEKWSSVRLLAQSPTLHLCGSDGQVYEYDYVAVTDDDASISWFFETKEFQHPGFNIRHDELSFSAVGSSVDVYYREGEGSEWSFMKTVTLNPVFQKHSINQQFVTRKWQYRFEGTSGGFQIKWLSFTYRLEDEAR